MRGLAVDPWGDDSLVDTPAGAIEVPGERLHLTHLLDAEGRPIYRRRPIGFGRPEEYVILSDSTGDTK